MISATRQISTTACAFNIVMVGFLPFIQSKENDVVLMDMEAGLSGEPLCCSYEEVQKLIDAIV